MKYYILSTNKKHQRIYQDTNEKDLLCIIIKESKIYYRWAGVDGVDFIELNIAKLHSIDQFLDHYRSFNFKRERVKYYI